MLLLFLTLYTGAAGCDGCINVNDSSNNGLADLVANLETVYQDNAFNASGVSRCSGQNSYLTRESCTLCPCAGLTCGPSWACGRCRTG